jgi:hypothetical protein
VPAPLAASVEHMCVWLVGRRGRQMPVASAYGNVTASSFDGALVPQAFRA